MALKVWGDATPGLTPFEEAQGGDSFAVADHVGDVVVIDVDEAKTIGTKYGDKTAISARIAVVDEAGAATVYEDALLFNAAIVAQLKSKVGDTIVATIISYQSNFGTTGYKLGTPTKNEFKQAQIYAATL